MTWESSYGCHPHALHAVLAQVMLWDWKVGTSTLISGHMAPVVCVDMSLDDKHMVRYKITWCGARYLIKTLRKDSPDCSTLLLILFLIERNSNTFSPGPSPFQVSGDKNGTVIVWDAVTAEAKQVGA